MTAPVLDSRVCGLWRTPCYHSAAIVASRQCLLVKERGQPDSEIKKGKEAVASAELPFLQTVF